MQRAADGFLDGVGRREKVDIFDTALFHLFGPRSGCHFETISNCMHFYGKKKIAKISGKKIAGGEGWPHRGQRQDPKRQASKHGRGQNNALAGAEISETILDQIHKDHITVGCRANC